MHSVLDTIIFFDYLYTVVLFRIICFTNGSLRQIVNIPWFADWYMWCTNLMSRYKAVSWLLCMKDSSEVVECEVEGKQSCLQLVKWLQKILRDGCWSSEPCQIFRQNTNTWLIINNVLIFMFSCFTSFLVRQA